MQYDVVCQTGYNNYILNTVEAKTKERAREFVLEKHLSASQRKNCKNINVYINKNMKTLTEAYQDMYHDEGDASETFINYLEALRFRPEETRKFEEIIETLGYRQGLVEFFGDNPGAVEKVLEFIEEWVGRNPEWEQNIKNATSELAGEEID